MNQLINRSINRSIPAIDVQTSEQDSGVTRFFANVDGATGTAHVRVPRFDNMRLVDVDVGVDVGRVDPMTRKVQRQVAARCYRFRFHCDNANVEQ